MKRQRYTAYLTDAQADRLAILSRDILDLQRRVRRLLAERRRITQSAHQKRLKTERQQQKEHTS